MKLLLLLSIIGGIAYGLTIQPQTVYVEAKPLEARVVNASPTPEPTPRVSDVVYAIAQEFESGEDYREDVQVVVKAIECFKSESGLNPKAIGVNHHEDGSTTKDRGIAQINDRWHPKLTDDEALDYKENVRYAKEMYESRGTFAAPGWYGTGCQ